MIERKPFQRYKLDDENRRDTFTVAVNVEERAELEQMKEILEQPKDSTALKTLARIGAKTLQADKTMYILETIFENKRKNKRVGVNQYEL